jgi:hypothetical protein
MINNFVCTHANEGWIDIANTLKNGIKTVTSSSRLGSTVELLHTSLSIQDPKQRWIISKTSYQSCLYISRSRLDAEWLK